MSFQHLDDHQPFVPDDEFRAAARHEGRRLRRRRLSLAAGSGAALAAVVIGLLLVAGPRTDPDRVDTPPTPTTETTETTAASVPTSLTTRPTTETTETSTTTTAPALDLGDGNMQFETPSTNIGCYISYAEAICDIHDHAYPVPPPPSDCPLAYGPSVEVRPGRAGSFACVGGVAFVDGPVLEYGQGVRAGSIECRSSVEGVTCTTDDGHGFFQSRGAYRFW